MNWTSNVQRRASDLEKMRLQRALYRIEMWHMIYTRGEPVDAIDARDWILLRFSPWEIDEIGCVYDFLARRLARIIEDTWEAGLDGEDEYYRVLFAGGK